MKQWEAASDEFFDHTGKVLADLPPKQFFADSIVVETVVGKRKGQ